MKNRLIFAALCIAVVALAVDAAPLTSTHSRRLQRAQGADGAKTGGVTVRVNIGGEDVVSVGADPAAPSDINSQALSGAPPAAIHDSGPDSWMWWGGGSPPSWTQPGWPGNNDPWNRWDRWDRDRWNRDRWNRDRWNRDRWGNNRWWYRRRAA